MANETPRLKIPYPSQGESNYFNAYQDGMLAIDADVFAALSRPNIVIYGGGSVGWDFNSPDYEFTFDANISVQLPQYGIAQSVSSVTYSPLVVPPAHFMIMGANYGATSAVPVFIYASTQVAVDGNEIVLAWHNPTTHELIFTTGLVLALGDTATGIQPQGGGGGGSISVTDGSTTVNPATTVTVSGGTVTNLGGGNAEITVTAPPTPPLITQFVVAQDGTGSHSQIYKAIDDANDAFLLTGLDQIVFVRGGYYVEDIVFKSGVRVVAESNPNASVNNQVGMLFQRPAGVIVAGAHTFESGSRLRVAVQGICFVPYDNSLPVLQVDYTKDYTKNCIQFFDCFFSMDTGSEFTPLIATSDKECANLEMHFERCRMLYLNNAGSWTGMIYVGSNGGDQRYTFVDCSFETKGYTARLVFSANTVGSAEVRFTRCTFGQCYIDNGENQNPILGDLWLTDVTIDYPSRYPVVWYNAGNVYVTRCILSANGGYEAVYTHDGTVLSDSLSVTPYQFTGQARTVQAVGYGSYVQPARTIEGCTLSLTGIATVDMDALLDTGYNYTCVSWYTVGGAGLREVRLHNAAKTMGMMFTVWDSGNNANSRNITVTSPTTAGGVTGPNTVITHANGSLTFVATVDQNNVPHWRSISYYH